MPPSSKTSKKRAVGIVRVSKVGDRDEEHLHSPVDQRDRILALADSEDWKLTFAPEELNVSGDSPLEDRPGLSQAVIAVQTGAADIIVAAHTERLWWNAEIRSQVLRLVEGVGGEVWSVDEGRLTNGTAAEEFSGTVRTSADRFSRRQNAEKSRAAVTRAVANGVLPHPRVPPGYLRGEDGVLVPDPKTAPIVAKAFKLRADGATVTAVREYLADNGIERGHPAVNKMLGSKVFLGEIHFGALVNTDAHEPIVERDVWRAVQRIRVPRGRKPRSERLLARLGLLRCAGCGGQMVGGTQTKKARGRHAQVVYEFYRCPPERHARHDPDRCKARATIAGHLVEEVVIDAVRERLGNAEFQATVASHSKEALDALASAQDALSAAVRAFSGSGLEDEPAAVERLRELREERDRSQERVDQLEAESVVPVTIKPGVEWDELDLDEKRMLIRATVERVEVRKGGRGAERITVTMDDFDWKKEKRKRKKTRRTE